jgi:hypothetical protein
MKFNKNQINIFLDYDLNYKNIENKNLNIILSPSLYWVKKFSIPTTSLREAKKLLPSLFEDILPDSDYKYYAYFENDLLIGFAYNDKSIIKLLEEKNIPLSNVKSVRFAQNEFNKDLLPCKINEKFCLIEKEDIILKLPCEFASSPKQPDLSNLKLSKHTISVQQYDHIIDSKTFDKLIIMIFVFLFLVGFDLYTTKKQIAIQRYKESLLFEKYDLLATTFQNKSLLKKYKSINQKQQKLKSLFATAIRIRLKNNEVLHSIEYDSKKIKFTFKNISDKKRILSYFKNYAISHTNYKNKTLQLEINL